MGKTGGMTDKINKTSDNPTPELTARAINSLQEITAEQWNACANPEWAIHNPFVRYEYLRALEDSGSAVAATGWQPMHLVLEQDGTTLGVAPLYLKNHSQGEYVFDHSWADALQRAGGSYYPKLQGSIPFTPASGRRLLTRNDSVEDQQALLGGCIQLADQLEVSSLHFTFMQEDQWKVAGDAQLLQRIDQQFHWHNPGYASFDDFLADLASKKRKNLKRERRDALANEITIEWVTGSDLTEAHWDAFYQFYEDTGSRKWGTPYLTREFFSLATETMAEDILLIMCKREDRYIAGALNFIGGDTLFGRNWGCIEDHRFLHFETCYYQAIDFAIARGLKRVEAGAQGGHKVARGYLPQATHSAHWLRNAGFRDAVARYLEEEREYVRQDIAHVEEHTPFNANIVIDDLRS